MGGIIVGTVSPTEDKDKTDESGVCPSGGTNKLDRRADKDAIDAFFRRSSPAPNTSIGSSTANPITSIPRFPSLATLASVPASTMVLVMTLCACRLYSGTIIRLPVDCVAKLARDVDEADEYMDTSDRFDRPDVVRTSGESDTGVCGADDGPDPDAPSSTDCLPDGTLSREGGTS